MARQNKEKKALTWKFYTILSSSIVAAILILIAALIIIYVNVNTDTYDNKFEEWTEYKINYNQLEDLIDDNSGGYSIIFAYDKNYMTQSEIDELDSDDTMRQTYIKCNEALAAFYEKVEENHELFKKDEENTSDLYKRVDFYVINVSLHGNAAFNEDEKYGNVGSAPSVIILDDDGNFLSKLGEEDYGSDVELTNGKGDYKNLTKDLKELKDFIETINNSAN